MNGSTETILRKTPLFASLTDNETQALAVRATIESGTEDFAGVCWDEDVVEHETDVRGTGVRYSGLHAACFVRSAGLPRVRRTSHETRSARSEEHTPALQS